MHYPYEGLEPYTLANLFDRSVKLYSKRPAFGWVDGAIMNYDEVAAKVDALIKILQENGIKKGDRVALLSENMPNWPVAYLSITYIGAVVVPILPDFNPADVHHILRHSEAQGIFVSSKHQHTIEELTDSKISFVINLDRLEPIKDLDNFSYIDQFRKKIADKIKKNQEKYRPKEDDLAALLYTSGTTGHSKGVMLTHKNLTTNAMSSFSVIKILPEDVFLSILPLAHTFECTVGMLVPVLHGSSVRYLDKAPTPTILLRAFEKVRPTMMLSVPLVIEKIFKNKILTKINASFITRTLYRFAFFKKLIHKKAGAKLMETFGGRLRFYGIGGAPLPTYVEEFLHDGGIPYVVGYGLTETAPLLCGTPIDQPKKIGSTGPALYGVEIKIKEPNEKGEGEICAKSPSVMVGYYKDEAKTKEVFDEDGWFLTGDLGYLDDDGYLFISGRSKNMILGPSGENIYPEQIESIINKHPLVLDSLVLEKDGKLVARVHLDYEQIDKLLHAQKRPNEEVQKEIKELLESMRKEINTHLATFSKITKFIEQQEPFIKTPTKKIKRYLYQD
ncbi:Long-chain-fatty-acid--CoA ligase [hydrothermal vent metagenome]|uniref:Long-chain-fatty-acid--CoA ligase n=1 Tax=hydrothermal vent metagenome TaxID=652676 RepID=A0A1W1B8Y7_9ZZZZ